MPILPLPLFHYVSIHVVVFNPIPYGTCSVNRRSDGVAGNVRSRHCLSCGTSGRASRIIVLNLGSGLMSRK